MQFSSKINAIKIISIVLSLAILNSSCATVFGGAKQKVWVTSTPSGAQIFVNGTNTGKTTPAKIKVKRKVKNTDTSTKKTQTYTLKKAGYKDAIHSDRGKVRGGAVFFSILLFPSLLIDLPIGIPIGAFRKYPKKVDMFLNPKNDELTNQTPSISDAGSEKKKVESIEDLEKQKQAAIAAEDYELAGELKLKIERASSTVTVEDLEKQKQAAIAAGDYELAGELKLKIEHLAPPSAIVTEVILATNKREKEWAAIKEKGISTSTALSSLSSVGEVSASNTKRTKITNSESTVKYRRSSLYTLMISDNTREHASVIKDAFGNAELSQKFNNHNIGPYLVEAEAAQKDQTPVLTSYLSTNDVAKSLVAKWFNRDAEGKFNMNLVASRGTYDASAMDINVASASQRGSALLADAGEELIKKTFVIIHDFKFVSKEEIAKKTKKGLGALKFAAGFIPGAGSAVSSAVGLASVAVGIAGKGYVIKATSYLYQLNWNEETEAIFYNQYWVDEHSFDQAKKEAFDNSNAFSLKLVGSEVAMADIQSSVFTQKSDEDLIRMATVKATDKAIGKLQRKFEEFRIKTPLYSGSPLAAKIGLKEGLEKGDKFEVLEQVMDSDGRTKYKRVGTIKVDPKHIWDNTLSLEEMEAMAEEGTLPNEQFTLFNGGGNYYAGLLIRQIK